MIKLALAIIGGFLVIVGSILIFVFVAPTPNHPHAYMNLLGFFLTALGVIIIAIMAGMWIAEQLKEKDEWEELGWLGDEL